MVRAIRSVGLPPELNDIVEKNIEDFSEYVQNHIREDFQNQESIDRKIKEHEDAITELKKLKIQTKPSGSKEEEIFIQGARKRVNDNPGELHENCRVYNQRFGKKISPDKFREMIQ